jgi:DNA-binding MarR family transcriptional regulator
MMNDRIIGLVSEAKALNSKIFSLPKLLILLSIENLGSDGATYRELKAGLGLDDGILYSSLISMKKMGYISEQRIKVEKKEMSSYSITPEGKGAIKAVRAWIGRWMRGE